MASLKQNCLFKQAEFLGHPHPKGRTEAYSWVTGVGRWDRPAPSQSRRETGVYGQFSVLIRLCYSLLFCFMTENVKLCTNNNITNPMCPSLSLTSPRPVLTHLCPALPSPASHSTAQLLSILSAPRPPPWWQLSAAERAGGKLPNRTGLHSLGQIGEENMMVRPGAQLLQKDCDPRGHSPDPSWTQLPEIIQRDPRDASSVPLPQRPRELTPQWWWFAERQASSLEPEKPGPAQRVLYGEVPEASLRT